VFDGRIRGDGWPVGRQRKGQDGDEEAGKVHGGI
jgi:hypothetical protein